MSLAQIHTYRRRRQQKGDKRSRVVLRHANFDSLRGVRSPTFVCAEMIFVCAEMIFVCAEMIFVCAEMIFVCAEMIFVCAEMIFVYAEIDSCITLH
ncbi:MAG: hypothetical protein C6Y22_16335 [Hapalosiphonaceae cyanobacterium JJU2]|nr:MAG: hypothetical protein C6Y22_16335 [Hapalosiphonaceae cyanobacterium JJU2]